MTAPERPDLLPHEVREAWPNTGGLALSVVAPVFDEELNLIRLFEKVVEALGPKRDWELVLVDDGSRDASARIIRELHQRDSRVKGVFFSRNCGQTAALAAGFQVAAGECIATMDADLQNDPSDLPAMVQMLQSGGHDAVVGWREKRQDSFVRRVASRVANGLRNSITADAIRDTGCSLKVFRRAPIQALPLFEGMHRFLPTLLRTYGFDVVETPVSHHPRVAGVSKYGITNRLGKAMKDVLAVRWMRRRRLLLPIHEVLR